MIWCLIKTRDNPWLISHMQSAKSDNGYFSMKGNTHTMCIACNLLGSFSLKGLCSSTIINLKIWFLDWLLKLIFCQVAAAWKFRSTMFSFISCLLSWKMKIRHCCQKSFEQIVTKPNLEFLYQLLKVVLHFIDIFSISVEYEVIQFENFSCAINSQSECQTSKCMH